MKQMKNEFLIKREDIDYSISLKDGILKITGLKNKWIKISTYKVLKKDVKPILSALDTIEYIVSDERSTQKFFIAYDKNSIIFYLYQVNSNIYKNIVEFKAVLLDKKEI